MIQINIVANELSQGGGATSETIGVENTLLLTEHAFEGTHHIANFLMRCVKSILEILGLESYPTIEAALYAVLVILVAFMAGAIIKWILLRVVNKIANNYDNDLINNLRSVRFFTKLSRVIPPLIFLIMIQLTFSIKVSMSVLLTKCGWIYISIAASIAMNALIESVFVHINETRNKKNLPLKGLLQLMRWVIWIICAIIVVAIIVEKSPATLLAGLGAFAAVLMLIFKDSILGVVAGVQLAENDMLREGDWIKVDGTTANGMVKEVSLVSVKVQNWDKTITTLPPYSLISNTFQNYRNMLESGTRRIMRCYFIDADSIRFTDEKMLDEISQLKFMKDYIFKKKEQQQKGKIENISNSENLVDGTIETNIGLLRAYVKMYLDAHPNIDHYNTCFVNVLEATPSGIPLQVYCFTATSEWTKYEGVQSEVFEHIAAVLPKFGLYTFENPSGRDSVNEGYLEAGGDPDALYGLPYPFLRPQKH